MLLLIWLFSCQSLSLSVSCLVLSSFSLKAGGRCDNCNPTDTSLQPGKWCPISSPDTCVIVSLNPYLAPQGDSTGLSHFLHGAAWLCLPTQRYQHPGAMLLMSDARERDREWRGSGSRHHEGKHGNIKDRKQRIEKRTLLQDHTHVKARLWCMLFVAISYSFYFNQLDKLTGSVVINP